MGRLCAIFCTISVIAVFIAVFGTIIWLGHTQRWHIHVNVESADLVRFDLDRNQSLRYNLTLKASVRNANWAAIYYTKLEMRASYDGQEFSVANLPTFTQWQKSTEMIYPAFHGHSNMSSSSALAKFSRENVEGLYSIDVKGYIEMRMEWDEDDSEGFSRRRSKGYALEVGCPLKVPMSINGTTSTGFNATACSVKW